MSLEEYKRKRNFSKTEEPSGKKNLKSSKHKKNIYVIQKHKARNLHYDFRLEIGGLLKSWAIPRGPSIDPRQKRLSVEVEDHPLDYADFEGVIPEGEYGAGKVLIWDKGHFKQRSPDDDLEEMMSNGLIKIEITGQKLYGAFTLVKTKWAGKKNNWLLIKENDEYARPGSDIVNEQPLSAVSGKDIKAIV